MLRFNPETMNSWQYIVALTAVMTIACLGAGVAGWMLRDTWRDRKYVKFGEPLYTFRIMKFMAGGAMFLRSMPEVVYLQIYNDPFISPYFVELVISSKQLADTTALTFMIIWVTALILIYPPVFQPGVDYIYSSDTMKKNIKWSKLARPIFGFGCIAVISFGFAFAQVFTERS